MYGQKREKARIEGQIPLFLPQALYISARARLKTRDRARDSIKYVTIQEW